MSFASQPLNKALSLKKSNFFPTLLLASGMIIALSAAAYGYIESQRTERVVIAIRAIPSGQQISAEDLGVIEVPLHRPIQIAGITNPDLALGQWSAREIGINDLLQPMMLLDQPPGQPVYPNGEQLTTGMVPVPFSTQTIGPLTQRDVVNIGFNDTSGDQRLCQQSSGQALPAGNPAQARPYACRFLQRVRVLYIDEGQQIAYLEMSPYQAHAIWAIQAAGLTLWGERYGATSERLPNMERLDISQISVEQLELPGTGAIPGTP